MPTVDYNFTEKQPAKICNHCGNPFEDGQPVIMYKVLGEMGLPTYYHEACEEQRRRTQKEPPELTQGQSSKSA